MVEQRVNLEIHYGEEKIHGQSINFLKSMQELNTGKNNSAFYRTAQHILNITFITNTTMIANIVYPSALFRLCVQIKTRL